MKYIFYTLLFLIFSFPAQAQISDFSELTEADLSRIDSVMKELRYRQDNTDNLQMTEEEFVMQFREILKSALPPGKASAYEQMLTMMLPNPEGSPLAIDQKYPLLHLTPAQYKNIEDYRLSLHKKQDPVITVNEFDQQIQTYLLTLLSEDQKKSYPDYLQKNNQQKIKTQRKTLSLILPGFEPDDAALLAIIHGEGNRPLLTSRYPFPNQLEMRQAYRKHLEHIVTPEKLRQFDEISAPLDAEQKPQLLKNDSAVWAVRYSQLKDYNKWCREVFHPKMVALYQQYKSKIPEQVFTQLDTLRKMNMNFNGILSPMVSTVYNPWQIKYKTLLKEHLLVFPEIQKSIDYQRYVGETVVVRRVPGFYALRESILHHFDRNDLKSLMAELSALETLQVDYMREFTPELSQIWYSNDGPSSIIGLNRVLNFLLRVGDN